MEVIIDDWGYMVSINSQSELDELRLGTLEGEILEFVNEAPYNIPTGKKLTLAVDPTITQLSLEFSPKDYRTWNGLQRVDMRMSPGEYQEIYFKGRVRGTQPRLPINVLIQG